MMQCIEATGSRTRAGYGQATLTIGRRSLVGLLQHRVAWEQSWGLKIPPGMVVRHSCDNRGCVNPLHLMVGTDADNAQDMIARGRHWRQSQEDCPHGHPLEQRRPGSRQRRCMTCRRASNRIYKANRRNQA